MPRLTLRRRSSPSIAILLLTATLAGVLAYQAWDAAKSHRATAEGALRDYAAFAAWEFSLSAKEELYQTLVSIFGPVRHEKPLPRGARLAPPSILAHPLTERVLCPDQTSYFFRLDLPRQTLALHGKHPSAEMQRWIRDTIVADLAEYRKDWSYSTVSGSIGGNPCSIVYQVKWTSDWKPAAAYGFQLCLTGLAEPSFARTMKSARLLPPSLTKGLPNDTMMSVVLRDGAGHKIWRTSHQFAPKYVGEASVPYFGGLVTQVALNPRFADHLLIGGLPRSRLPLLLGVLGLTMGLALVGVLQLRREDELARLRGDFIANVSHELRTPLAQLRMFAETLLLGRVRSESERRRSLEIVDQEARRLSHLVENVLQFSRAERHTIKLRPVDEPLAIHVRAAHELFEPIVRARQVRVAMTLDETIRCPVDPGALRQILLNLLDNAVKYGPVGQEVRIALARSPDGRFARIVVEDEGPGIPRERRERVWEPFYRLDRDADSAVAGSGIGLSVVRELATKLGGSARIEDSRVGARLVVELPLCQEARAAGAGAPAGVGAGGGVA
jgi:signal transduction histidine kinase